MHKVHAASPRDRQLECDNENNILLLTSTRRGGGGAHRGSHCGSDGLQVPSQGPSGQPFLSLSSHRLEDLRMAAGRAEGTYRRLFHPWVMRALSLLLYALSLCIATSQLFIYEGLPLWLKRISPLKAMIGLMEPNLTLIQITCLALLGYVHFSTLLLPLPFFL